jgi:hypothetical protein
MAPRPMIELLKEYIAANKLLADDYIEGAEHPGL